MLVFVCLWPDFINLWRFCEMVCMYVTTVKWLWLFGTFLKLQPGLQFSVLSQLRGFTTVLKFMGSLWMCFHVYHALLWTGFQYYTLTKGLFRWLSWLVKEIIWSRMGPRYLTEDLEDIWGSYWVLVKDNFVFVGGEGCQIVRIPFCLAGVTVYFWWASQGIVWLQLVRANGNWIQWLHHRHKCIYYS